MHFSDIPPHTITNRRSAPRDLDRPLRQANPSAGWLEVHTGPGILLGWVSTQNPEADDNDQSITAATLSRGRIRFNTSHRFGAQEFAAGWVARHHEPRPVFDTGDHALYTGPQGKRQRVVIKKAMWRGYRLGHHYVCRPVNKTGPEYWLGGPCLASLDGRTQAAYPGITMDPITLAERLAATSGQHAASELYQQLRQDLGGQECVRVWRQAARLLANAL